MIRAGALLSLHFWSATKCSRCCGWITETVVSAMSNSFKIAELLPFVVSRLRHARGYTMNKWIFFLTFSIAQPSTVALIKSSSSPLIQQSKNSAWNFQHRFLYYVNCIKLAAHVHSVCWQQCVERLQDNVKIYLVDIDDLSTHFAMSFYRSWHWFHVPQANEKIQLSEKWVFVTRLVEYLHSSNDAADGGGNCRRNCFAESESQRWGNRACNRRSRRRVRMKTSRDYNCCSSTSVESSV